MWSGTQLISVVPYQQKTEGENESPVGLAEFTVSDNVMHIHHKDAWSFYKSYPQQGSLRKIKGPYKTGNKG